MIDRRTVIRLAVAGAVLLPLRPLFAQEMSEELDYEDIETPFPPTYRLFGTNPALGPEEDQAREILAKAPTGKTLLETARYFEQLKIKNQDEHMYNAQWPDRWNPVIVGFYQPEKKSESIQFLKGDTTPWCAAFINWCLYRGGYKNTKSPLSGSFRIPPGPGLGTVTTNPKPGDIIVFKNKDKDEANVGKGHVGIFIKKVPRGFMVLGGNQNAGKHYSSINTTFFPERSASLVLDSIRSFESIPRVK